MSKAMITSLQEALDELLLVCDITHPDSRAVEIVKRWAEMGYPVEALALRADVPQGRGIGFHTNADMMRGR